MKTCKKCEKLKHEDDFYYNKSYKDEKDIYCSNCRKMIAATRHREKESEYDKHKFKAESWDQNFIYF